MTAFKSALYVLKFMSKRSQFIVETKIPDMESYERNRPLYEKAFDRCNGTAFLVCYLGEGIDDDKKAMLLTCFENDEDVKKFHEYITVKEVVWSEEHSVDRVVERILINLDE